MGHGGISFSEKILLLKVVLDFIPRCMCDRESNEMFSIGSWLAFFATYNLRGRVFSFFILLISDLKNSSPKCDHSVMQSFTVIYIVK